MPGLNVKKSGTEISSWDFYITGHKEWLEAPLPADKNGALLGIDGTELTRFEKGSKIQIMNLELETINGRQLARVKIGDYIGWTPPSRIAKPTHNKNQSSEWRGQERQEQWVNDVVNESVAINYGKPVTIKVGSFEAGSYISSRKNEGYNKFGHEKYADLIWTSTSEGDDRVSMNFGVSMKIGIPPSVFGGGYTGLCNLDADYIHHISRKAFDAATRDSRFELGSFERLTDIYVLITNASFKKKAFQGDQDMGGPVKYMFVGTEEPLFAREGPTLLFPTSHLYSQDSYYQAVPRVYIRIRRRNATDVFTDKVGKDGVPLIFTKESGIGEQRARYVAIEYATPIALTIDDT